MCVSSGAFCSHSWLTSDRLALDDLWLKTTIKRMLSTSWHCKNRRVLTGRRILLLFWRRNFEAIYIEVVAQLSTYSSDVQPQVDGTVHLQRHIHISRDWGTWVTWHESADSIALTKATHKRKYSGSRWLRRCWLKINNSGPKNIVSNSSISLLAMCATCNQSHKCYDRSIGEMRASLQWVDMWFWQISCRRQASITQDGSRTLAAWNWSEYNTKRRAWSRWEGKVLTHSCPAKVHTFMAF